jgi:hypothetical protein
MAKKINLKIIFLFAGLYLFGFYLLIRIYSLIIFKSFKDIILNIDKPGINEKRIIYFDYLTAFQNLLIISFLAVIVIWIKFFKREIYRESLIAFLIFVGILFIIGLLVPSIKPI